MEKCIRLYPQRTDFFITVCLQLWRSWIIVCINHATTQLNSLIIIFLVRFFIFSIKTSKCASLNTFLSFRLFHKICGRFDGNKLPVLFCFRRDPALSPGLSSVILRTDRLSSKASHVDTANIFRQCRCGQCVVQS